MRLGACSDQVRRMLPCATSFRRHACLLVCAYVSCTRAPAPTLGAPRPCCMPHRRQVPSLAPEPDNYWDSDDGPAMPAAAGEEEDTEVEGGGGADDEASLLRGLLGGSGLETLGQDWNEEEEWDEEDDEFLDDDEDVLEEMVDEDDEDAFLAQYDDDDDEEEEVCVCVCVCVCVFVCV